MVFAVLMMFNGVMYDLLLYLRTHINNLDIKRIKPTSTTITVSEGPSAPNNIIVMYRGYIFSFDAIFNEQQLLCPQEIAYQLYYIEKWCQAQDRDGPGVGALTVTDRSVWAKNRDYLRTLHPENARILDLIEKSVMVFAYEDSEPLTPTDV